jgi:hypothetical protein
MRKKLIAGVVVAAAALLIGPMARANSELELISGSTTVTLATGSPITYNGSVGGWDINVTTGTFVGTSGLELNSVDASSMGIGTPLEILWSSSFAPASGTYVASVGGTMDVTMADSFSSYYGSTLFSTANPLTAPLIFTSNPFSGTDSGAISGSATYLTEMAILNGALIPGSETSFDFQLAGTGTPPVPDGGPTLILLGCAMGGLAVFRRKAPKV